MPPRECMHSGAEWVGLLVKFAVGARWARGSDKLWWAFSMGVAHPGHWSQANTCNA